jgi:signal transduction histidine kinase
MRLVGDLADLWRAEARQLALRIEPVDVERIVGETLKRFAPTADERRVRFDTDVRSGTAVLADRDRLVQILANYLSNAIRYAPTGSAILVRARREGAEVHLSVTDNGAGLSIEQQAQVFERFYRLDAARSRDEGGAGIGLSIVRALAEAMDGRAWAESAGPGRGSSFFVSLPATPV